MHIGLICPELYGHLNPLTTLGGELVRRGHRVTLLGPPSARALAERQSLELAPIGVAEDAAGDVMARWRRLGELKGFASMRETGRVLFESARIVRRDAPSIVRTESIDGLIVDQVSPAGVVTAYECDVPFVVACNALSCHFDWRVPPPPLMWKFHDNLFGRARNVVGRYLVVPIYNRAARAKDVGVKPLMLVFEQEHGLAHIAQQPAFFDFPRDKWPEHFHYTGPWYRSERDDHVDFPWDKLDGRPLIYASMGTLQNRLAGVFQTIAEAARGVPAQLVLSLGGSGLAPPPNLPENVIATPYAPQIRLLEKTSVAITHAGLNTALECISHGVPMICLPITNDQPGVSRRAEWLGIAEVFNVHRVSAGQLRNSMLRLFDDDATSQRAQRYQAEIRRSDGLAKAATIVEQAFATGKKVLS